jgi:Fanconi anemia group M protein
MDAPGRPAIKGCVDGLILIPMMMEGRDRGATGTFTSHASFVTTMRVPLVVDSNEPEDIPEKLRELGVEFEIKKIAPGDYVLGPIGIERKTLYDFFNSMIRKRLFEQVQRLRDAYPQPLLILEGDLAEISTFRHPQSIMGALLALETSERVPVLTTADKGQTALLLSVLWKRQDKGAAEYGLRHKPKALTLDEKQRFIIEGLPSIGETLAKNLLGHFGSVRAIFNASEEELKKVPKIGDLKAAEIVRLMTAKYAGEQKRLDGDER